QKHAQHNASSHRANQQNCLTDSLSDLQRDRLSAVASRSLIDHGDCGTSEAKQHGLLSLDQLLRLVSRSAHVRGLVGLRQTFTRRRLDTPLSTAPPPSPRPTPRGSGATQFCFIVVLLLCSSC